MSEHIRKDGFQWCDAEVYLVMDFFTALERSSRDGYVFKTLDQALEFATSRGGWQTRTAILKVPAIMAYKLADPTSTSNGFQEQK